jgi:hypothetical protein
MAVAAKNFASLLAEAEQDAASENNVPNQTCDKESPGASENQAKESCINMVRRHMSEIQQMEELCRSKISESKKKNKNIRDSVQGECVNLRRACFERQNKELARFPVSEVTLAQDMAELSMSSSEAIAEVETDDKPGFSYSASGKKSKQQKKKEAKAKDAEKRYQDAKDSMKDWIDPKEVEEQKLQVIQSL